MNTEKTDSTPARWYSLLGLVLVPLLVAGGFLIAGLTSSGNYKSVQAAIVNLDDPVTINGTYIPLGRQLTANLVDSKRTENLTWSLDSEQNARAGLATGAYAAMVIIPKNFSAAATSYSGDAAQAEKATLELSTSPVAGVADATLGKAVALAATDSLNQTLTSTYLDKIYIGFNDMGTQFTTMADGTDALASGLETMNSKTSSMPADTRKLATGTGEYVTGVNELANQTIDSLPQQVQLAQGVNQLSQGATGLSTGLSTYQSTLSRQASDANADATRITKALTDFSVGAISEAELRNAVTTLDACSTVDTGTTTSELVTGAKVCIASLTAASQALQGAAAGLSTKDARTGQSLISGASALASGTSELDQKLTASLPDVAATTTKLEKLIAGGNQLAASTSELADGMPALTAGISEAATGARQLATGVAEGKSKLPSYTDNERETLTDVASAPVSTTGLTGLASPDLGWVSLLLILSLWLGAFGTYSVLKAISRGLLGSAEPSAKLIGEALLPGVAVVATQALLMAWLAHLGLGLSWAKTFEITGVLLIAGATFAVLNQALVSWAGNFGRLVSVLFAVLTAASTLAAAAPGTLNSLRAFSPLSPALDALRAVITDSGGAPTALLTVVGWLLIGLLASSIGIVRHRTTNLASVVAV